MIMDDQLTRGERLRLEALAQARLLLGIIMIPEAKVGEPLTIFHLFKTAEHIEDFLKAAVEELN